MLRFRVVSGLGLTLTLLYSLASAQVQTPSSATDHASIETFLRGWQKSNLIEQTEFDKLKTLGKAALPLLAEFLRDPDLAFYAESAMHQIDPDGATPYLLKDLPRRDRNVQRAAYRIANQRIQEYAWYVRQGKRTAEPAAPARYYTANTRPVPYLRELHEAAVQSLQSNINADTMEETLLTLGLTGSRRDTALLKKFTETTEDDFWKRKLRTAGRAALARLGDPDTLALLERELQKPVQTKPAERIVTDHGQTVPPKPGAIVVSHEDGQRLHEAIFAAEFAMNRRFIPFLISHLDDPPGQAHGDYWDPSPALDAKQALNQIVFGKEFADSFDWKVWWQARR